MVLREMGPLPYANAGILAIVIMVVSVVLCVLGDPDWDYTNGSMCDFGVSEVKYVSVLFIGACIVSGLLFMFSGIGWYLFEGSRFVRAGGLVVVISGAALICVGVFDKTFPFHQYVSIIYAIIFIVAIALVSIQDIMDRHFILVLGLAALGLFGLVTIFVDMVPYSFVQVVLMGYVFIWYVFKSLKYHDPGSGLVRAIIGMD